MEKKICPHCGQDWIRKYRVKGTDSLFYLCPECESLWLSEKELDQQTDLYLSEYMSKYDAAEVWEKIEEV
ncbi:MULTISPECIES: hypothetical protein [unclassified Streptomyces]|uniref:hypothetical protein n=1 Tax=unclassified Streptomyces TaxID=2593676 RepID=UPI0036888976